MSPRPIYDALEELRIEKDDLKRASHRTFDDILARYVSHLSGSPLGELLDKILPSVDFDLFWNASTATIGVR